MIFILRNLRKDLTMNRIYLDQASTSFPKAPGVAQAMMDYLTMNR